MLADFFEIAAAAIAFRLINLDHDQRDALGALFRVGLGHHADETRVLAVGDEGLLAVDDVLVAVEFRGRSHGLQIGAGAGLGHGDRGDELAGGELRQPLFLLLFRAVMQEIRCHDAAVHGVAPAGDARADLFLDQHLLVRERAARAAVSLGDHRAEKTRRARLVPDFAIDDALAFPALDMRHAFALEKAPRAVAENCQFLGLLHAACTFAESAITRLPLQSCPIRRPQANASDRVRGKPAFP